MRKIRCAPIKASKSSTESVKWNVSVHPMSSFYIHLRGEAQQNTGQNDLYCFLPSVLASQAGILLKFRLFPEPGFTLDYVTAHCWAGLFGGVDLSAKGWTRLPPHSSSSVAYFLSLGELGSRQKYSISHILTSSSKLGYTLVCVKPWTKWEFCPASVSFMKDTNHFNKWEGHCGHRNASLRTYS